MGKITIDITVQHYNPTEISESWTLKTLSTVQISGCNFRDKTIAYYIIEADDGMEDHHWKISELGKYNNNYGDFADYTNLTEEEYFQTMLIWDYTIPIDEVIAMQKYLLEQTNKYECFREPYVLVEY